MTPDCHDSRDLAQRSGAEVLADTLHRFGTRHVGHVPGEGILELLDALAQRHPDVGLTTFRHEGGMVYAAQAIGRLGDTPGVCLAARAPGALNTTLALHTADTDSAPLLMIVGQAPQDQSDRDPLSGNDLAQVFAPLAKLVLTLGAAARIPEQMARAWHTALSGRPGPVVVVVPENVMHERVAVADLPAPTAPRPAVGAGQLATLQALLADAQRPLLMVGGSGWTDGAHRALAALASTRQWPVVAGYRHADLMDHADPHFVGELGIGIDPVLAVSVAEADLLIAVNLRLGELNSFGPVGFGGFRLLDVPSPAQRLVHFHPDVAELQRVHQADLAIQAGPLESLQALLSPSPSPLPSLPQPQAAWTTRLRAQRIAYIIQGTCTGPVHLREVMQTLRAKLPDDTVVTVGAGAYAMWLQRYFALRRPGTLLGPESGAMGYGLPAAIGAALSRPDARVVAVAGDGCFLMHAEELATAVQRRLRITVLVVNNSGYGAIRGSQERLFGRATGTALHNPDFAAFARAFGAHAEQVRTTAEFLPALERCLAIDGPGLIELQVPSSVGKPT